MYLNNFIEIIFGKLLNKPAIRMISEVTSRADLIKKGNVFIARDKNEIKTAINNGAYAIVSDECVEIIDSEIAWILVDNLKDAVLKFIKYTQLMNNIEVFVCASDTLILARQVLKDKIGFASDEFEMLENLKSQIILIDFEILLFPVSRLERALCESNVINQTMFESSIEFNHKIHTMAIPSVFLENLNEILSFASQKHIEPNFATPRDLLPVFIDLNGNLVEQSMRCVYATKNKTIALAYAEFFIGATWGNSLFLTNEEIKVKNINTKFYKTKDEILRELRDSRVHFFVVLGVELEELKKDIVKPFNEPTLF